LFLINLLTNKLFSNRERRHFEEVIKCFILKLIKANSLNLGKVGLIHNTRSEIS
jgi:hypothetical protein